jgi:hypothetical protein
MKGSSRNLLIGEEPLVRFASAFFLFFVLIALVAQEVSFGFDCRFLSPGIVLRYARPSDACALWAAGYIGLLSAAFAVPRLRIVSLVGRVFDRGVYFGLADERPKMFAAVVAALYIAGPVLVAFTAASLKTTFDVAQLGSTAIGGVSEAVIVGPAEDGVLLALYDRKNNTILANELYIDTFSGPEPQVARREHLGIPRRSP